MLQNKGLRCALNKDEELSTVEIHKETKMLKLKYRRDQHYLSHMFDRAQNDEKLKKRGTGMLTCSQNKVLLKIRKPNTEKFKKSLTYKGQKKWNDLPEHFQHLSVRKLFNSQFEKHINSLADTAKVKAKGEG